jgi:hypothetical protein
MAAKEIIVKKYVVRLSDDEREQLAKLIRRGSGLAQRLLKARILLKADVSEAGEGWSDNEIIEALETSASMVYRVRKQLVEEGLDAVLSRKPLAAPAVPKIFDGEKEAKLQMTRLSAIKTLAGFDFSFQPSLDRNRIMALAELRFIDHAESLHLIGPPGTGKSHLSLALGVEAVKAGRSVYFGSLADIIGALAKAEREGVLREKIRFFRRFALLIVDEIGYLPVIPDGGNLVICASPDDRAPLRPAAR